MRVRRPRRSAFAILAGLCLASSCDDAILPEPVAPTSSLVISSSTPASGNATLTSAAQELAENRIRLTQIAQGVTHVIDVEWDRASVQVRSVEHTWTTPQSSSTTKCPSSGCRSSEIAVDAEARTITFVDVDLVGRVLIVAQLRSTLDGTIRW